MRILSAGVCGSVATDVASATHRLVRRGIGRHAQGVDPEPRMSEIPWMIMDNTEAARDLGRHIAMSILEGIAQYASHHPGLLAVRRP